MKTRCQPGDRCVVVADVPGAECNIGAELTVTRVVHLINPPAWEFKDASRPLKMPIIEYGTNVMSDTPAIWCTESGEVSETRYPTMFDHHLVPIKPAPAFEPKSEPAMLTLGEYVTSCAELA